MNNKSSLLTALAVGAVVGGILGILFAPDEGSKTREKIAEKGKKLSQEAKEKFESGKDFLNHLKTNGKESSTL